MNDKTLKDIDSKIRLMVKTAGELNELAGELPTVVRNTTRILASLKMLEINISDYVEL